MDSTQLLKLHFMSKGKGRRLLRGVLAGLDVLRRPALKTHAQRQAHLSQNFLDLLQGLPTKVLRLQHLCLRTLNELADVLNVGSLEAICTPHRQLQLVYATKKMLVDLLERVLDDHRIRLLLLIKVDEDAWIH